MSPFREVQVRWHAGPRAELVESFELAEDSPLQLAGYLPLGRVLVALDGEAIVGHLQLLPGESADAIELKSMAVAEAHQGRGIGRALAERAIAECRADGARTLLVSTATADTGNLRFYQRLGFRLLRVERDAFTPETGYPDVIMIDGIALRDRVWLSLEIA